MATMDMRLEVVPIPISDVDRAEAFYAENVGFNVDRGPGETRVMRVVQLTPPGFACSIVVGRGIIEARPGSVQVPHLVVADIGAARRTGRAGRGGW